MQLSGDYYGEIVDLAARLVREATPSTLLVSENVRDRAGAAFRFEPRGRLILKGFAEPTPAYSCFPLS